MKMETKINNSMLFILPQEFEQIFGGPIYLTLFSE